MPGERSRRLVIGIGNPDRGDDALGRLAARRLRGALPADVEVIEQDGETTALLAALEGAATAVLIDACASGAPAGRLHRFDVSEAPLPNQSFAFSTHGLGLGEAVELARILGQLPVRCIVLAVEAAGFEPGAPLSPPVAAALDPLCAQVRAELDGGGAKG